MKKIIKVALIFLFNLSLFSQDLRETKLDSLFTLIEQKIDFREINAAQNLLDQINILAKTEDDKLKVNFWESKIDVENGEDEKSLEKLLKGFTRLKNHNSSQLYTKYAESIGRIFGRAKNYDKALKYFSLALKNAFKRKDSLDVSSAYFSLGSTYQMKNNLDSASYFYDNVIRFHPKYLKNKQILATTYNNLMSLAIRDSDFDLAEAYGKESLIIHTLNKDTLKMAGVLNNLGGINMYRNNLEKSNEYSFEALKLLKNRKSIKAREIKGYAFDNISQIYYLQGNYKEAYDNLFESSEIRHAIITDNLESKVTEIEAKYNLAKEGERTKIEENKRQKTEFWLYILVFTSIMLLIVLWFTYRSFKFKRKNLKLEFVQGKMVAEHKIEKIKNETQVKILNATIDAKEFERKYIAEILHDSVSTLLSSANMHLYALRSKLKGKLPEEILKTENIVNEAADKIRNLSHQLISPVLLKFGLKAAIEDLCEKYSNSQLSFSCMTKNIDRFNHSFEIKIHNIIEELINNILKHSGASEAFIKLEQVEGDLHIKIMDNGVGFDIGEIHQKDGLGLSQIDARIKIMKGKFKINSSNENGTHIFMSIPITDNK